jgi:hypothetical protein
MASADVTIGPSTRCGRRFSNRSVSHPLPVSDPRAQEELSRRKRFGTTPDFVQREWRRGSHFVDQPPTRTQTRQSEGLRVELLQARSFWCDPDTSAGLDWDNTPTAASCSPTLTSRTPDRSPAPIPTASSAHWCGAFAEPRRHDVYGQRHSLRTFFTTHSERSSTCILAIRRGHARGLRHSDHAGELALDLIQTFRSV